jgi:hypothetical protein
MAPREKLTQSQDKQLEGISFNAVMEKRRLDQALNAKEFAVCSGVSYSTARSWFRLPGFPVFRGVVFWEDFVRWRSTHVTSSEPSNTRKTMGNSFAAASLPPRAANILRNV